MGTGGGKEHNLCFFALCDCVFTAPQSEGAWRAMELSCVFLHDSSMHMHSHAQAHTLQAPVPVGECVCV